MAYDKVIVFGPTGDVGCQTALEASKRGAHVYLAMRYPEKSLPILEGSDGKFTRIKADLSDPVSCANLIKESGAKAAYIYWVQTQDGSKSSLAAMKDAGLEYVVFLSSFSIVIEQDIRTMDSKDFIAHAHAQVEISLEDVSFKAGFVAMRGGNFASNTINFQLNRSTTPWSTDLLFPDMITDAITPVDLGRVGGALLVSPPEGAAAGKRICMLGPELISHDKQWETIKRISGKDIKINSYENNPEGYKELLISKGLPPPVADNVVDSNTESRKNPQKYYGHFEEEKGNVKKYSGYEPMSFEEFIASQKW